MFAVPAAAAIVTTLIALIAGGLWQLDGLFVGWARRVLGRSRVADRVLRLVSFTPVPIVTLFIIPLALFLGGGNGYAAGFLFLVCMLALGVSFGLKHGILRQRPDDVLLMLGRLDSSFPSAHTSGSFAAAFALAYLVPSVALPALSFATIVALSRLYLGVHYLSDVAGGMLLAYGFTLFAIYSDVIDFVWQLVVTICNLQSSI